MSTVLGFVSLTNGTVVRRLEDAGVSSFWVGGHIASVNPSPEPVVWLARLIEQTRVATVGTATQLLPLYPPHSSPSRSPISTMLRVDRPHHGVWDDR